MKFFMKLAVLFYTVLVIALSCLIFLFAFQLIPFDVVSGVTSMLYFDEHVRLILGIVAGVLLLKNYLFFRGIAFETQRQKTVAFYNPSGQVLISLSAFEDLLKRMIIKMPEVKDVRSFIKFKPRKGLQVKIRLALKSDVNIPEFTAALQEEVKTKIQTTIGLEEPIVVSIYVGRIVAEAVKNKGNDKPLLTPTVETHLPFQGYRA